MLLSRHWGDTQIRKLSLKLRNQKFQVINKGRKPFFHRSASAPLKPFQITVWHRLAKESDERTRNLLRGREALAGCRGAAMTGLFPLHRAGRETGIASHKQKKGIPGAIPYPVRHCSHQSSVSGIPCQSTPGIPPTGLTTTGFNGIKTDAGIPFQTRGGIPPEAFAGKASG